MKKLLLDECLPQSLRKHLPEFEVYTVAYMGWEGVKNGKLLQLATDNHFDIFLTADRNIHYQQNIATAPITVVAFELVRLELEYILVLLPQFKSRAASFEKSKVYVIR